MSESNFLIISGRGCHLAGDKILPRELFSYYEDDNVWVYDSIERRRDSRIFCFSKQQNVINDVLLIFSLFVLAKKYYQNNQDLLTLTQKAIDYFKTDILETNKIDTTNDIEAEKLDELYELNKTILKSFSRLKFLAIYLGNVRLKFGGYNPNTLPVQFLNTMDDYEIKNYELCETSFSKIYGVFGL